MALIDSVDHSLWWLALGLTLLALEIVTVTFGFLFFGLSALIVAFICWQWGLQDFMWEMTLFAGLGLISVPFFRKRMRLTLSRSPAVGTDVGQEIVLTSGLSSQAVGQTEYQGVPWEIFNDSPHTLLPGDRVVIKRVEGIRLVVQPLHSKPGSTKEQ